MAHSSNELPGTTGLFQILPGEEIEQQALQTAGGQRRRREAAAGAAAAAAAAASAVAPAIVSGHPEKTEQKVGLKKQYPHCPKLLTLDFDESSHHRIAINTTNSQATNRQRRAVGGTSTTTTTPKYCLFSGPTAGGGQTQ
jgi:hypothetical protein